MNATQHTMLFLSMGPALLASAAQAPEPSLTLMGPSSQVVEWSASEWTLRIDNQSSRALPFHEYLLGMEGYGGARLYFEVIASDGTESIVTANDYLGPTCGTYRSEVLPSGEENTLPIILHGRMVTDLAARATGDGPGRVFTPIFEGPGQFTITAVLRWERQHFRSNPVRITILPAPRDSLEILRTIKQLAAEGFCLDVQALHHSDWGNLERIAELVAAEEHSVYSEQLRIGLAKSLIYIGRLSAPNVQSHRTSTRTDASVERVARLLAHRFQPETGVNNLLREVRLTIDQATRLLAEEKSGRARQGIENWSVHVPGG